MTHIHTSQLILPLQAARQAAAHVSSSLGRPVSSRVLLYKTSVTRRQATCRRTWSRAAADKFHIRAYYPAAAATPKLQLRPPPQTQIRSVSGFVVATMAERIDLEALVPKNSNQDAVESRVAAILDPALNGSGSADDVVNGISNLYRSGYNSDEKAEDFLWAFWTFYIEVVKKVSAQDSRLQLLVLIVERLKARSDGSVEIWGKETKVWADLPMLGPCAREAWNFIPKFDGSDKDNAAISSWISLNSFAARLLGSSITSGTEFAIWALRDGLEEEHDSSAELNGHIAVTHEWVVNAGQVLLNGAAKNQELDDTQKRTLKGGKLFGGEPGLNKERWTFWQQRVEELSSKTDNEDAKTKAQKTLETIKTLGV
ncbi:hypothetical protein V2G26_008969 [Clonostachys chloroleuca]